MWGSLWFSAASTLLNFTDQGLFSIILLDIGWVLMVSGSLFVLYSRLHILNPNKKVQRTILICIVVNAILFNGSVVASTVTAIIHVSPTILRVFDIGSYTEVAFSTIHTIYTFIFFSDSPRIQEVRQQQKKL